MTGDRGVPCPKCGSFRHGVIDTRHQEGYVARRRECYSGHRFTTWELDSQEVKRMKGMVDTLGKLVKQVRSE